MRMKIFQYMIFLFLLAIWGCIHAQHLHQEKDYQKKWCDDQGGKMEFLLDDKTRVDCLLPEYAIESDFAQKWAEAIGQALFYALKTGKKPGVVLIVEDPEKEGHFVERLKIVAVKHKISLWVMTKTDLESTKKNDSDLSEQIRRRRREMILQYGLEGEPI